jgi:hypothetical protein
VWARTFVSENLDRVMVRFGRLLEWLETARYIEVVPNIGYRLGPLEPPLSEEDKTVEVTQDVRTHASVG